MKKFLKQLFCHHEWDAIDSFYSGAYLCIPTFNIVLKCSKCSKEKIDEQFLPGQLSDYKDKF